MYNNIKETPKKLKSGKVGFYDIRPGNGAGLLSMKGQVRDEMSRER